MLLANFKFLCRLSYILYSSPLSGRDNFIGWLLFIYLRNIIVLSVRNLNLILNGILRALVHKNCAFHHGARKRHCCGVCNLIKVLLSVLSSVYVRLILAILIHTDVVGVLELADVTTRLRTLHAIARLALFSLLLPCLLAENLITLSRGRGRFLIKITHSKGCC